MKGIPAPQVGYWLRLLMLLSVSIPAEPVLAWVYPEHRDIAILAVQGLDPQRRATFDELWQDARSGDDQRLCAQGADAEQGLAPPCIDWAALSGASGDHSCSSQELLQTVRTSDWLLVVADIAAQLKTDLARIPVTTAPTTGETIAADARRRLTSEKFRAQRLNALRTADTRMQRADSHYATRADANLAHFLLARPDTNLDPDAYSMLTLKPGTNLNAVGVYAWYHISALEKANRLGSEQLGPEERRALARSALFDEAFALHFLEDTYASGHVSGSWGDVSQRKGTHDFYNQNGLEVFTWKGRDKTIVLMGDAHMRPEDAALAAGAARTSLEQVLDAATGRARGYRLPPPADASLQPDDFDICRNTTFPDRGLGLGTGGHSPYAAPLNEALLETAVPGLGPGLGALPRARSEVGKFMGLAGAIDIRSLNGGFVPSEDGNGWLAGLDLGFRAGLGLEGALGDSGDGLVFGQIGLKTDTASSNDAAGTALGGLSGSLGAAVPARSGLSARVRMPFYLVPGDLLFLSPLYWLDRAEYEEMAVTSANGGLLGWQQGWATRYGRFQFVLGRELGIVWYGPIGNNQLAAPGVASRGPGRVVNYKSLYFDLPILEYRPYRAFSDNQSSSVIFQFFGAADFPYGESIDSPKGAPSIDLDPIYSLGLRMVFDWRYYY